MTEELRNQTRVCTCCNKVLPFQVLPLREAELLQLWGLQLLSDATAATVAEAEQTGSDPIMRPLK